MRRAERFYREMILCGRENRRGSRAGRWWALAWRRGLAWGALGLAGAAVGALAWALSAVLAAATLWGEGAGLW